jgi:large subunit ribosomal protein L30
MSEQKKIAAKENVKPKKEAKEIVKGKPYFAAVRVRGTTGVRFDFTKTLECLNLYKKNFCILIENTPSSKGMLQKVKDFITWGEADDATIDLLKKERDEGKRFFRLSSPRKGYGRKGVKCSFTIGGALGYRGKEINSLIKRMI